MYENWLAAIILFLSLFFVTRSLFNQGFFPTHDDIQTMRVLVMGKCLLDGQIPCRWVPDMGFGYGYPQFNYYAPLPYYFMGLIHIAGVGVIDSVKLGFITSFLLSAIGMYLLGEKIWGKGGGVLSAMFYLYLPYRAVNVYARGAMGEIWAMSIIPFVFLFVYRMSTRFEKKDLLGLSLSLAALITSHNVTTLIAAPFAVIWGLFFILTTEKIQRPKKILRLAIAGMWGIGFSSFFLIPAWFEKNLVHVDSIIMGYFNYLAHFVGLKQLLFGNFWGYGSSELGPYDDLLLSIGVLWWTLPLLSLVCFCLFKLKHKTVVSLVVFLGFLSLFFVHPKSTPIWQFIETLTFVQFPWRFLSIAGFFFSLATGSLALLFKADGKTVKLTLFCFVILTLFYSGLFRPQKIIKITDDEKFSGKSWIQQQTISIFDYLPVSADLPPTEPAPDSLVSKEGEFEEVGHEYGTNWKAWEINVKKNNTKISIPVIYSPQWKVFDNGKELDFEIIEGNGVMSVSLSEGKHYIEARLTDTWIRMLGNMLTLISFISIPIFLYAFKVTKES